MFHTNEIIHQYQFSNNQNIIFYKKKKLIIKQIQYDYQRNKNQIFFVDMAATGYF